MRETQLVEQRVASKVALMADLRDVVMVAQTVELKAMLKVEPLAVL